MVGYVFGVLEATAVPGTVLVPLLTDLGMSPVAVRTMLSRMVAAGNLASERAGRIAVYRLAGPYGDRFHQLRRRDSRPQWTGAFELVLYTIPEARRSDRDVLRETAFRAGFGAARPGVLIGLGDPRRWCGPWLGAADLSVELGQLVCDLPTARRLVHRAWNLAAAEPTLTAFLDELTDLTRGSGPAGLSPRQSYQLQAELWDRWVSMLVRLPSLPTELAPDPWPVPAVAASMTTVTVQLQPGAIAHAQAVLASAAGAELLEPLPDRQFSWDASAASMSPAILSGVVVGA